VFPDFEQTRFLSKVQLNLNRIVLHHRLNLYPVTMPSFTSKWIMIVLLAANAMVQRVFSSVVLPIDDSVFALRQIISAGSSTEIPIPGNYTVTFLPVENDNLKLDMTIQVFNTIMTTMNFNGATISETGAIADVTMDPVRSTMMMPEPDAYKVEIAIGEILSTVDTVFIEMLQDDTMTVTITLEGSGGTIVVDQEF
jgi:hypothetical protein